MKALSLLTIAALVVSVVGTEVYRNDPHARIKHGNPYLNIHADPKGHGRPVDDGKGHEKGFSGLFSRRGFIPNAKHIPIHPDFHGDKSHPDIHDAKSHSDFHAPKRPIVIPSAKSRPNTVDKLIARIENVQDQLKTTREQLVAEEARLVAQRAFVDELRHVVLLALRETDSAQASALDALVDHASDINDRAENGLILPLFELIKINDANTANLAQFQGNVLDAGNDLSQFRAVRDVADRVDDFLGNVLQGRSNRFQVLNNQVARAAGRLEGAKNKERKRVCETGTVTLPAGDLKAEYQFLNHFDLPPRIQYGISGFREEIRGDDDDGKDARVKTITLPDPHPYGYVLSPKPKPKIAQQMERLGVFVDALASKTGVTLEAFDLGTDDFPFASVDVWFQACSIGQGFTH